MKKIILTILMFIVTATAPAFALDAFQKNYLKLSYGYGKITGKQPSVFGGKKSTTNMYHVGAGTYFTRDIRGGVDLFSVNRLAQSNAATGYSYVYSGFGLAANVFYDMNLGSVITPFVGVGMNYSRMKASYKDQSNAGNNAKSKSKRLGYNFVVGTSINLAQNLKLDVNYQYMHIGTMPSANLGGNKSKTKLALNTAVIGIRFTY